MLKSSYLGSIPGALLHVLICTASTVLGRLKIAVGAGSGGNRVHTI